MIRFFKNLYRAYKIVSRVARIRRLTNVNWSDDDKNVCETFVNSDTGLKINRLLAQLSLDAAYKAVRTQDNRDYLCGKSLGVDEALFYIEYLGLSKSDTDIVDKEYIDTLNENFFG